VNKATEINKTNTSNFFILSPFVTFWN